MDNILSTFEYHSWILWWGPKFRNNFSNFSFVSAHHSEGVTPNDPVTQIHMYMVAWTTGGRTRSELHVILHFWNSNWSRVTTWVRLKGTSLIVLYSMGTCMWICVISANTSNMASAAADFAPKSLRPQYHLSSDDEQDGCVLPSSLCQYYYQAQYYCQARSS